MPIFGDSESLRARGIAVVVDHSERLADWKTSCRCPACIHGAIGASLIFSLLLQATDNPHVAAVSVWQIVAADIPVNIT